MIGMESVRVIARDDRCSSDELEVGLEELIEDLSLQEENDAM